MLDLFETSKEINLKPSVEYFPHAAPRTFRLHNYFASNSHGDILFSVGIEFWIDQNNETGVVTIRRFRAEAAKYHVKSGDSCVFTVDPDLATDDLQRMICFYVLNDFLGLGEIGRGRILVYGSQKQRNGEPEVIAHSLSADPRPSSVLKYPDINLTAQIANFVTLLKADLPNCGIIPTELFVKDNHMYFLIKNQENSKMALHTIGRMRICENDEKSKKTSKECYKLLTATGHSSHDVSILYYELNLSVQRGRSVWLGFIALDFKQMLTISWFLPYITSRLIQKVIEISLNFAGRMRRLDGGWTLRMLQKCFGWIYGPSMTPEITFPMIYEIYNLDLETLVYKKVNYGPKFGKSGAINYPLPISMDSDIRGGLLLCEVPTEEKQELNVRYFSPPHQPETLARLAENMIYRKHSSFAQDEIIRRGLGVCDYNWKL